MAREPKSDEKISAQLAAIAGEWRQLNNSEKAVGIVSTLGWWILTVFPYSNTQPGLQREEPLTHRPGTNRKTKHAPSFIKFTISTLERPTRLVTAVPMSPQLTFYLCDFPAFIA